MMPEQRLRVEFELQIIRRTIWLQKGKNDYISPTIDSNVFIEGLIDDFKEKI